MVPAQLRIPAGGHDEHQPGAGSPRHPADPGMEEPGLRGTGPLPAPGSRHSVVAAETKNPASAMCRHAYRAGMQSPAGERVARSKLARRPVACRFIADNAHHCSVYTTSLQASIRFCQCKRSCLPSESRQRLREKMSSARNRRNWSIQSGVVLGLSRTCARRRHQPIYKNIKRRRSQKGAALNDVIL